MALKSTEKFNTEQLVNKIENMGGQFQCVASRELIMYQAMIFPKDLSNVMEILGQIIRKPLLLPDQVQEAKMAARYDNHASQWDPNTTLPDKLHAIAYQNNPNYSKPLLELNPLMSQTLGKSPRIDPTILNDMNRDKIRQFIDTTFTPDRIAISCVGADHDEVVNLVEREFGDMSVAGPSILQAIKQVDTPAKYTGGTAIIETSNLAASPNPDDMVLTHVQVAFEAMGMRDPDIYALSTLGSLLGGGGSFSAGGPGKGMYTRLYTQVLNRNGWIENCNVINNTYKDSSLFGISIAVSSDEATHHHVANVLCDQIVTCTSKCTRTELDRAKNQLKSSLLMSLESQLVQLEDMGRQALAYGKRMHVDEMCRRIDLVNESDIIRVGRRVFLGEDTPSTFQFNDDFCQPWKPTGPWCPTVLVEGPLTGTNDTLWKIDETLQKWGISPRDSKRGRKKLFGFI